MIPNLSVPPNVSEWKFKALLHKRFFETGWGTAGKYVFYATGVFGVTSQQVELTMFLTLIEGVLCWVLGFLYYRFGFAEADTEITNQFNLFVKEMRDKISNGAPK